MGKFNDETVIVAITQELQNLKELSRYRLLDYGKAR